MLVNKVDFTLLHLKVCPLSNKLTYYIFSQKIKLILPNRKVFIVLILQEPMIIVDFTNIVINILTIILSNLILYYNQKFFNDYLISFHFFSNQ